MKFFECLRLPRPALGFLLPALGWGLTSGPSMPEYNDFEPVDATDMVNLATGDFSYTLPVMTVPGPGLGFPIVLSYHGGITPKQEASWVGLGWNLQAGAITREVNKVPDDFKGDPMKEEVKSSRIHGWMASISYNTATVGVSRDNMNGFGGMVGLSVGIKGTPLTVGATAGVNGVYEGVGVTLGASAGANIGGGLNVGGGLSIGIHSKRGVTVGAGPSLGFSTGDSKIPAGAASTNLASMGVSLSTQGGLSAGASVAGMGKQQFSVVGDQQNSSSGIWIPAFIPGVGFFEFNWGKWATWIEGVEENRYYGFLYADKTGMGCVSKTEEGETGTDCTDWANEDKKQELNDFGLPFNPGESPTSRSARLMTTAEDIYAVASQGISGVFKPTRKEDGDYLNTLEMKRFSYKARCKDQIIPLGKPCTRHIDVRRSKILEFSRDLLNSAGHTNLTEGDIYWRFTDDPGGAEYTDPNNRSASATIAARSRKIIPFFGSLGKLQGFNIVKTDGTLYTYSLALYNHYEKKVGKFTEDEEDKDGKELSQVTSQLMPSYAYAWLLTSIKAPDYVSLSGTCRDWNSLCDPTDGDLGGWVRFTYSDRRLFAWRTPYADNIRLGQFDAQYQDDGPVKSNLSDYGPSAFGKVMKDGAEFHTSRNASMGLKHIVYLNKIETPTHRAEFGHSADRQDGLPSLRNDVWFNLGSDQYAISGKESGATITIHTYPLYGRLYWLSLPEGTDITIKADVSTLSQSGRGGKVRGSKVERTFENATLGAAVLVSGDTPEISNVRIRLNLGHNTKLSRLESIRLFSKIHEGEAIGKVNFEYDYSLCPNTPNSLAPKHGKLTLRSVALGGGGSTFSPSYQFQYQNPDAPFQPPVKTKKNNALDWVPWEAQVWDRWGYRCESCSETYHEPDGTAAAWNLSKITLPSGGSINVNYEPKTFKYINIPQGSEPFLPAGNGEKRLLVNQGFEYDKSSHTVGMANVRKYLQQLGIGTSSYEVEVHVSALPPLGFDPETGLDPKYVVLVGDQRIEQSKLTSKQIPLVVKARVNLSEQSNFSIKIIAQNIAYDPGGQMVCAVEVSEGQECPEYREKEPSYYITENNRSSDIEYRIHAVFTGNPSQEKQGGGVRVKSLAFEDALTGNSNTARYTYSGGSVAVLPPSFSDYLDNRFPVNRGMDAVAGNSNVLYGEVKAEFVEQGYATKYRFLTPADMPVTSFSPGGLVGTDFRLGFKDFSALWGTLLRKEDLDASGKIVKSVTNVFAFNNELDGFNPDAAPQAEGTALWPFTNKLLVPYPKTVETHQTYSTPERYFGTVQSVSTHRYFHDICEDEDRNNMANCLKGSIATTQVVRRQFLPMKFKTVEMQEGLSHTTESYAWDFLTGIPLKTLRKNSNGDVHIDYTLPAYHRHLGMAVLNQLEQTYATIRYILPSSVPFTYKTGPEDGKYVHSAQYAQWRPIRVSGTSAGFAYRKTGEYNWENPPNQALGNIEGFKLPDDFCERGANSGNSGSECKENTQNPGQWRISERITRFDAFGHPLEFRLANDVYNSQSYGYGQLLPTSFTSNAKSGETFFEGFETKEALRRMSVSGSNSRLSVADRKAGAGALELSNIPSQSMACFDVPGLEAGKAYTASVFYFDATAGDLATSAEATRPGIFLGQEGGCGAENHPNGKMEPSGFVASALPGTVAYAMRATGSRRWIKLETEIKPGQCTDASKLSGAKVCLYASKGMPSGKAILYDELRVHPSDGLMTSFNYDREGRIVSSMDANGTVRYFEYDALGNLSAIRNDDQIVISESAKQFGRKK